MKPALFPQSKFCCKSHPVGMGGLTLIETLVTIVLLAVSLLGLAALQGQGMSATTDAYARTQASILAFDLTEKMRAYDPTNISDYGGTSAGSCDPLVNFDAANDLKCWEEGIDAALGPGSSGSVTLALSGTTGLTTVTISISWMERQLRQDEAQSYADDVTRTASWVTEL